MALDWVPETYAPSGGLAAAGFYKLLGRPRLDPLAVLVRETAQNSWDARAVEGQPVQFVISGWDLSPSEQRALRTRVFTSAEQVVGSDLADTLAAPGLRGLFVSDRETKGLGGPLQADEADPDDVYDWVDFVLNVGKPNTTGQTGGTYGFGKTISYVVSTVKTVVIHSRTLVRGKPQTRLIACAIGEEFSHRRKKCTGRHWWGRASTSGNPRPVTGREADALAAAIGMPTFEGEELGTNILVVAPDLGGRTPEQAMRFIAESVTWHLWPKMMSRDGEVPMKIYVGWNGEELTIPEPANRPPLHGFAQAFRAMLDGHGNTDEPAGTRHDLIGSRRPKTVAGDLVTVPLVQRPRVEVDDGHDPTDADSPVAAAMIDGPCHHVALFRSPELVVEYLEGPPPPEGGTEWAGVFRCRPEHDAAFALSEPPTHDSWSPELLPKGRDRTVVNVGLREIRKALQNRWTPSPGAEQAAVSSTARIADGLAHLVRTTEGMGRGRPERSGGGGGGGARQPRVAILSSGPAVVGTGLATRVSLEVTPQAGSNGTRLHVTCGAALDGSAIDADLDPDLVLLSADVDGRSRFLSGRVAEIEVPGTRRAVVEIIAARGPDTTVLFDIQSEAVTSG
ncbi:MAG TPA: hypothetical protein VK507_14175 [Iamia sp.]|nr:hypothetical protein [Iamia sp.]